MRRVVLWLASTVTVVVLLFGYHTSTDKASTDKTTQTSSGAPATSASSPPTSSPPTSSAPSASPSSTATGSSRPSPSGAPSKASPSPPAAKSGTYTGSVAQTRWGPVQVQIAVQAGRVTGVTVLQQPQGNRRDLEINDQALPVLISETVDAQSAHIDMVSGATVTSDGYLTSLQSALDKAGI